MSVWTWALMALSGQGGVEMSSAGMDVASAVGLSPASLLDDDMEEIPRLVFNDDAAPVLKVYYDAQPG